MSSNIPKNLLGFTVKDPITGVVGVVTAEINHLYGCRQVCLAPKVEPTTPSKLPDVAWLDADRVEVLLDVPPIQGKQTKSTGWNPTPPDRSPSNY